MTGRGLAAFAEDNVWEEKKKKNCGEWFGREPDRDGEEAVCVDQLSPRGDELCSGDS